MTVRDDVRVCSTLPYLKDNTINNRVSNILPPMDSHLCVPERNISFTGNKEYEEFIILIRIRKMQE